MAALPGAKSRDWVAELCSIHLKAILLALGLIILAYMEGFSILAGRSKSGDLEVVNCEVSFHTEPPYPSHKPVWIASYPSYMDYLLEPLLASLLGHEGAAKVYQPGLNFSTCLNKEANVCFTPYPLLDAKISPAAMNDNFNSEYIIALRNPYKAIPILARIEYAYNQNLNPKLAHTALPPEKWIKYRNKHFLDAIEDWTRLIEAWNKLPTYHKGFYAVHEHLVDPTKGEEETNKLAYVLRQSGYKVAPRNDIKCAWEKSISVWQEPQTAYPFLYTADQRDIMIVHLEDFMHTMAHDKTLVSILEQYVEEMKRDIIIDKDEG